MKLKIYFLIFILFSIKPLQSQWLADTRLTVDPAFSSTSFNNNGCVAAEGSTIHIVFFDDRDGNREIYYKRSTDDGTSWSQDTRLTNNSANSKFPSIAVTGSFVHIAWEEYRDGNAEIYYKRSTDDGLNWGNDLRLTNNAATSLSPAVCVSKSNVHVVWFDSRDGSGNREIYYKKSDDGGATWSADTRLTNNSASSIYPTISTSGSIVNVFWEEYRNGNGEIYSKHSSDAGTTWGPDTRLTFNSANSFSPASSISGYETAVTWFDSRDGNNEIYIKLSTDAGINWCPDMRLTNNWANSSFSSVVVSRTNIHVTWIDERDGNLEVYYKRTTNSGMCWEADVRLTNNQFRSTDPAIVVTDTNVHVIWTDARDNGGQYQGNYEIYYKKNPMGNPDAIELQLSLIFEGFYNSGRMNMRDTVTSYLRHATSPYAVVDLAKTVIDSATFNGTAIFYTAPTGTYFITVKHRNTIETWSKEGGELLSRGIPASYNFVNSVSQAFGDNMEQVDATPVRFAIFSGDGNQDGIVDVSDLTEVYNDAMMLALGYVCTDMNGDFFVDAADIIITFNNVVHMVEVIRP